MRIKGSKRRQDVLSWHSFLIQTIISCSWTTAIEFITPLIRRHHRRQCGEKF